MDERCRGDHSVDGSSSSIPATPDDVAVTHRLRVTERRDLQALQQFVKQSASMFSGLRSAWHAVFQFDARHDRHKGQRGKRKNALRNILVNVAKTYRDIRVDQDGRQLQARAFRKFDRLTCLNTVSRLPDGAQRCDQFRQLALLVNRIEAVSASRHRHSAISAISLP